MNQNGVIYTQADSGLNRFLQKSMVLVVWEWFVSLCIILMLYVFTDNMINIITNQPFIYYGAIFLELALVFLASSAARKYSISFAFVLFYSALNGFTLSLSLWHIHKRQFYKLLFHQL